MNNLGQARRALVGLAVVAVVAGCTGGDPIAAPTTTTTAVPTARTTTVQTLAQKQIAEAEVTAVRFVRVNDALGQDPSPDFRKIVSVARDQAAEQTRQIRLSQLKRKWRQVGDTQVVSMKTKPLGDERFAVTVCLDLKDVDVVDANGKSVVSRKAGETRDEDRYTVELTPDKGYVVEMRPDRGPVPC